MDKTIKKQLDKVQVAHLGTYDDSTTEIIIPKLIMSDIVAALLEKR